MPLLAYFRLCRFVEAILQGVDPQTTARQYAELRGGSEGGAVSSSANPQQARIPEASGRPLTYSLWR